ncbi:MAG: aldehyde dehydrogenase family protein, partial [Planctomycetia bacterium]
MKTISHVIGGQSVEVRGGRTAPVFNPATGAQTAEVQLASAAEVDAAVAAARAAFPAWAATPPLRRARLMNRLRDLIETH